MHEIVPELMSGYADELRDVAAEVDEPQRSRIILIANSIRNLARRSGGRPALRGRGLPGSDKPL